MPFQLAPGVLSWLRTGADAITRPRRTAASMRICPRTTRRLLLINMSVGAALLFASAAVGLVVPYPSLGMQVGPTSYMILVGSAMPLGALGGIAIPIFLAASIGLACRFWYSRKSPPIRPEVVWSNHALSSFGYVAGAAAAVALEAAWWVAAPRATITVPSSALRLLLSVAYELPMLSFFAGLMLATFIDWNVMKVNRYANVLEREAQADHGR